MVLSVLKPLNMLIRRRYIHGLALRDGNIKSARDSLEDFERFVALVPSFSSKDRLHGL